MNDLAVISGDAIEAAADPAQYVVLACERAKEWLANALHHGNIEQIVELKSQAEAIRIYTMQKQLGKDAELSAAEIVRRAERCMGLAIRKGQAEGAITKRGDNRFTLGLVDNKSSKPSPTAFASSTELCGSGVAPGAYDLADDVSATKFEQAIADAKAEKNLSRANVVRKIRADGRSPETAAMRREKIAELAARGYRSTQIAKEVGVDETTVRLNARKYGIEIPADRVAGKARKIDSNRIIREIVLSLETIETTVELIDFAQIDQSEIPGWIDSLVRSTRVVDRLRRRLKGAKA